MLASAAAKAMRLLERFAHDIRYAARFLRRSPRFALTAIAVLALGIGANTAVFSVAKDVLLRPLPYPEPDRLVQFVGHTRTGTIALASVPRFNWWKERVTADEMTTAYVGGGPGVTVVDGDRREHVAAMYVSWEYFRVFGMPMMFGRQFRFADDRPEGPRVVVISHAFAVQRFGPHQNPVGQLLNLGDGTHEIIGIADPSFRSQPHADIWLPLRAPLVSFNHTRYLTVVARLRKGVTVRAVERQVAESTAGFRAIFPDAFAPYETFGVEPLEHMIAGDSRPALQILTAAVVFVLLIACANAANLFVARASRRKADIATRAALGAGRLRLLRQLFAECVLLACAGGLVGLAVGQVGIRALVKAIPGALAEDAQVTTDANVLLFTLAVVVATAVVFGLLPALAASRVNLTAAMKDNAETSTRSRGGRQSLLVIAELTMAIVLLVGAGLLMRTFLDLRTVDRGFRSTGLLTFDVPLNGGSFRSGPAVNELVRDVKRRLEGVAGTRAVAATYSLPLESSVAFPFTLLDRALFSAPYHGLGQWRSVSPDYFSVFGVRLIQGRLFGETDDEKGMPVVIINRSMARKHWQDADPIGAKMIVGSSRDAEYDEQPRVIIGVVSDVRGVGANAAPQPMLYVPIAQTGDRILARNNRFFPLTWVVRTEADGSALRLNIERELRDATGGLPVARVQRIEDIVRAATAQLEFATVLLSIFAGAALLLAAVGLYGLMAFSVEQRRQEIGIRLALGAEPAALRNMVLVHGGRLTGAGVLLGLAGAFATARVMRRVIVGVGELDLTMFAIVAALLAAVAVIAAYLPAQDATRVDPLTALRRS